MTPPDVVGYAISERLGCGRLGEVFLARPTASSEPSRLVALRRFYPELLADAEQRSRVVELARIDVELVHPAIVACEPTRWSGGDLFLPMELVRGVTLRAVISARAKAPPGVVARLGIAICEALAAASAATDRSGQPRPIVHGDLRPSTVLVSDHGFVKVRDFALSALRQSSRDGSGSRTRGALDYLAPEWLQGATADLGGELFAVGIMLWETVTGRRLFARASDFDTLKAIVSEPIPAPSKYLPSVPDALEAIVLTALERDPARRFPHAPAMARALSVAAAENGWDTSVGALASWRSGRGTI